MPNHSQVSDFMQCQCKRFTSDKVQFSRLFRLDDSREQTRANEATATGFSWRICQRKESWARDGRMMKNVFLITPFVEARELWNAGGKPGTTCLRSWLHVPNEFAFVDCVRVTPRKTGDCRVGGMDNKYRISKQCGRTPQNLISTVTQQTAVNP